MKQIISKKKCTGCLACYNICPKQAITIEEDEEGFVYPNINEEKCIKCGLCERICPCINNRENNNFEKPSVMASWSLDKENKLGSSSGGCFFELAKYIIEQGGVVFGAAYDKEFNVVHKGVDTLQELSTLKGSKYVQSNIEDCYIQAQEYLKEERLVLFVGTPCQIAGLYAFLRNKYYENLYTIDLICHGVPSYKVYRKYLEELSVKYNSKPISINFREKSGGWKNYRVKIVFRNKQYMKNASEDIYMRAFLSDKCLRLSCYNCQFSKLPRVADITLGDFWGINNISTELDDDTGTSEVLINSKKGRMLLEAIKGNVFIKELGLEDGIKYNPCLVVGTKKIDGREQFISEIDNMSLYDLSKKYFPQRNKIITLLSKIKHKIYSIIKKQM